MPEACQEHGFHARSMAFCNDVAREALFLIFAVTKGRCHFFDCSKRDHLFRILPTLGRAWREPFQVLRSLGRSLCAPRGHPGGHFGHPGATFGTQGSLGASKMVLLKRCQTPGSSFLDFWRSQGPIFTFWTPQKGDTFSRFAHIGTRLGTLGPVLGRLGPPFVIYGNLVPVWVLPSKVERLCADVGPEKPF